MNNIIFSFVANLYLFYKIMLYIYKNINNYHNL